MDGVLSNPFAHAVATALRVDGSTRVEDVLTVETDLFRANDINSDDTSTVRVTTRRGTTLLFAATLCSPVVDNPEVIVSGTSSDGNPLVHQRRDRPDRSSRRNPDERADRQLRSRQPLGEPDRSPG